MSAAPIVDVHAHVLLPGLQAMAADRDPDGFAAAGEIRASTSADRVRHRPPSAAR